MNIYGFLIGLGVVIVIASVDKFFKDKIKLIDYILGGLTTLFFARLAFIIHYIPQLLEDYLLFFRIHEGGVSILGAIVGLLISMWFISKKRDINFWGITDSIFLVLPLPQILGRIGNFFNQELYGYPTQLPWGIHIEEQNRLSGYTEYDRFHPIFAYEIVLNAINFFILLKIYRKYNISKGIITAFFLFNYGIIRILVNRFRLEKGYILNLETSDLFASTLIAVGCLMLVYLIFSKDLQTKIAKIFSKILNPFLITSIPFFVIAFQKELFTIEPLYISIILFIGIFGPILQFYIFKKLRIINDWDISDRSKRPLFTSIAGTIFFALFLISLFSVSTNIKVFTLSLTLATYFFALISTVWKISGHLMFLTFTLAALYLLTNSPIIAYLFLPLIIFVAWSRVELKQHDIYQVIAGALLGFGSITMVWFLATQPLSF